MRSVGAQPGGLVQVTVTTRKVLGTRLSFRVDGRVYFAPSFYTGGLGSGATMTLSALTDLQCPPGADRNACQRNVQRGTIYWLHSPSECPAANVLAFFPRPAGRATTPGPAAAG